MKKIIFFIAAGALLFMSSCNDDFIETKNLYGKTLESFYQRPQDIDEAMAGVYATLHISGVHSNEHLAAMLMSDQLLGGGGPDDKSAKYVDNFEDPAEDTYKALWVETYKGVYRANAIIEAMVNTDYRDFFDTEEEATTFKNQALGEAYFMRGFLLNRAAKFFGGIPLIITTGTPRDIPRASISDTYAQIIQDYKIAAETLPDLSADKEAIERYGHANRWVAQAYIAKAFLYYTGYMTNIEKQATDEIALPGDGSVMTKASVVAYLDDCIANSGYELLPDFRNLWPYSYVNESARKSNPTGTHPVLRWAEDEGLAWAGQDGFHSVNGSGNTEVMFALRYSFGNWDWEKLQAYNNEVCLYTAIRDNGDQMPFGQGWGWCTVHPTLFAQWDDADERKKGSILEIGDADQGTESVSGKGDHYTGLYNKKYISLQHEGEKGKVGMFNYIYDYNDVDMQVRHAQDFYYMRFADVLLMHSELTETATGLNLVRKRAGYTDDIAFSLQALKNERTYEFAFEGQRWFDIVRWGDVENSAMNLYDNVVNVNNSGVDAEYSVTYRAETKGLVSIPESEIRLSNFVYKQNNGWED